MIRYLVIIISCFFSQVAYTQTLPANWPAHYPDWWYHADPSKRVVDETKLDEQDNYAPINQGQLLHLASMGILELDEQLAPIGGAGFTVDDFRDLGISPAYYAPVTLGQAKFVSSKFMDRFRAIGYGPGAPGWPATLVLNDTSAGVTDNSPHYPWLNDQTPANFTIVNLGQAKHLFSWDASVWATTVDWSSIDADGDGLGDVWEMQHGFSVFDDGSGNPDNGPAGDPDGDGLTNIQEFDIAQLYTDPAAPDVMDPHASDSDRDGRSDAVEIAEGTDPTDYYNLASATHKKTPVIQVISGDEQLATVGQPLANSITIRVTALEDGSVLQDAPVRVDPKIFGALVGMQPDGSDFTDVIVLYTDASGNATFYAQP